jgi:hypothetical protein
MSLIDDIKRDREAGTPGPWSVVTTDGPDCRVLGGFDVFGQCVSGTTWINPNNDNVAAKANARRIARVPDMEAALIAAEELAQELETLHDAEFSGSLRRALAAYRKATEAQT